jgi:hypothetical protein
MNATIRNYSPALALAALLLLPQSGHCFYNPSTGRWLNRDPIGENGGGNLHAFARNEPVEHVDRLGQEVLCYYTEDGVWTCRSPIEGCCNGKRYLYSTECCCDGLVIQKKKTTSGIFTVKWLSPYPNPQNPGSAHDMHVWLTWPGGSIDSNAYHNDIIFSPAAGPRMPEYQFPLPHETPVMLSRCVYDFEKLYKCLSRKASQFIPMKTPIGVGMFPPGNCEDFAKWILNSCMRESKGCTRFLPCDEDTRG